MNLMHHILRRNFIQNNVVKSAKILDVGCGNGDLVMFMRENGYNAFGVDIEFRGGEHAAKLLTSGVLKKIEIGSNTRASLGGGDTYIWPEFDDLFDVLVSRAVIEHVQNLEEFVQSSKNVLKAGGICIHYFPSKYSIIEPHTGVPFGGFLTNRTYTKLMCFLGLCFKNYRKNANIAHDYMMKYTAYRKQVDIDRLFQKAGFRRIKSIGPLQSHPKKVFRLLGLFPLMNYLFSIFRSRVVAYERI